MFGKTELIQYSVILICLCASVTDYLWGKIYNSLTVPALLLGVAFMAYSQGLPGIEASLLGVLAGLLFYGWLFGLKWMGGGDVKLLMALGAWGGPRYAEEVALLGVLVGGVISLLALGISGKLLSFARRFYLFLLSIFIREMEPHFPGIDKKTTIPFGIAISVAAIWSILLHPMEKWGLLLW